VVLDFARRGIRIVEQPIDGCCTADIKTRRGLEAEASDMQAARVTTIQGFPALIAPQGTESPGWYVQVSRPATEVIVTAPNPGTTEAALIRVVESLWPMRPPR
jgi:hypothetical protein